VFLAALVGLVIYDHQQRPSEEGGSAPDRKDRAVQESRENRRTGTETHPRKIQRVAIIIDDIGYDLSQVDELLQIDVPLTFSILPFCTNSIEAADKVHRAGKEILLHLPMEPRDYPRKNPGRGVLLTLMTEEEVRRSLDDALSAVPHASGVNNHMGSKFMEDGEKLAVVFKTLKGKGLFFVDSLTTKNSRGRSLARDIGLPFVSRDIFIDNGRDFGKTYQAFMKLPKGKKRRRDLVVIGHPYPGTIEALQASVQRFRSEGIEIVPVSEIVKKKP